MTSAGNNTPVVDVRGVTLQYKTSDHLVTATYRVDFNVLRSDRFVLLGPSGCGKSTLLKAIGGYMHPTEGSIRLNGREVSRPGPDRMMVFQEFDQLLPWKTVLQNVMFPLVTSGKYERSAAREKALGLIEKVNLAKFADSYPHTLVRRHEATRRDRARHGDGAGRAADGRALRRARCTHPRAHAGRAARAVGRNQVHRDLCHAFDSRSGEDRKSHSSAHAASRPGQGRDQQRAARQGRDRRPARNWVRRFTLCCLPTRVEDTRHD